MTARSDASPWIADTAQHLEEADRLAHHVALLDAGRIVAQETPDEL
jgi:ABC-type multidrug transport system ATPase subunit